MRIVPIALRRLDRRRPPALAGLGGLPRGLQGDGARFHAGRWRWVRTLKAYTLACVVSLCVVISCFAATLFCVCCCCEARGSSYRASSQRPAESGQHTQPGEAGDAPDSRLYARANGQRAAAAAGGRRAQVGAFEPVTGRVCRQTPTSACRGCAFLRTLY